MAITAELNLSASPPTLTVTSDKRAVSVTVVSGGETAVATGSFPVRVVDSSGRAWTQKSDDGKTAVFTG